MDMQLTQINSDSLIPIEQHLRVSAGPGAGKTHWLVTHIQNVLHQSKRLAKTRKIACITYTNVAVSEILEGLEGVADRVEISTIHSFLYKHIVKPYATFIDTDYGLNIKEIDRHDDIVLSSYSFLREWKKRTKQQRIKDDKKVVQAFEVLKWKFDKKGNLVVKPDYPHKVNGYSIKNKSYFEYKRMAWEKGVIHHDDVLFFSHHLIQKFPFILQVLRAKFPYFFIDEFQDTNPIQTKILEQIGLEETIVGIIGDKAQSIYGFQGASPEQFSSFALPNIIDYQIAYNRRSTNLIIKLLNAIRTDIQQEKFKNEEGNKAIIIVGEMIEALSKSQELCNNEDVYSLSRDNITSNAMKREINQDIPSTDLLQTLYDIDSNSDRKKLIIACIKAIELSCQTRFKESIKELERIFKDKADRNKGKKVALKHIISLLKEYDDYKDKPLIYFQTFVSDNIQNVPGFNRGKIKTFYENNTYQQLAVCVKITEDTSLHRTIHKAKGTEFDNVLLVLKNESDLAFILNPAFENEEEHRVYYVAISRAKKQLFIAIPSLARNDRLKLEPLIDIIELNKS